LEVAEEGEVGEVEGMKKENMKQKYKINIHAHTLFSDGANSPLGMAIEANRLGFTALVITDHYYGDTDQWCSVNVQKMRLLKKACEEAKKILPVIIGVELVFGGEELLTFGSAMIQDIMRHRDAGNELTMELFLKWKRRHDSAFVLCHPGKVENWEVLRPLLDGYEEYNSGSSMFRIERGQGGVTERDRGALVGLPGWCNSDAHQVAGLARAYNIVDAKIENETDLIRYIKRGAQPEPYLRHAD
jgi:predicted metal-dependent phosphoesterase TrpH